MHHTNVHSIVPKNRYRCLFSQFERVSNLELFALAVAAVVGDVALQVDLEVRAECLESVVKGESGDGVEREHQVGAERSLQRHSLAVSRGGADDELVVRAQVEDAVPEPRGVDQNVSGVEHGGVSLKLVEPWRRG